MLHLHVVFVVVVQMMAKAIFTALMEHLLIHGNVVVVHGEVKFHGAYQMLMVTCFYQVAHLMMVF